METAASQRRPAPGVCGRSPWKLALVGVVWYLWSASVAWAERARPSSRPFRQVRSTQGIARGYYVSRPPHYAFLGLPYARAPTPHNRFKAPEAPPSWDGIFEATHRVRCPQDGGGEENCLVINVFTPLNGTPLPVLVLVHDGNFQEGRGALQPPARFLKQGILIVTFNYRLGLLGFLCLGTSDAPGNAGLKDQVAALYWVQRNIASFGGNPADVTLYGSGSGAIAVHLLLLSGLTDGLFHKVVLQSGSALSPLALNYEPVSLAINGATSLGYEGDDDLNNVVEFFEKFPLKKLTNISETFLPCIESHDYSLSLIDWDPIQVLKKGSFQQVPIVMLYSSQDGMSLVKKNMEHFENLPTYFEELLPNNLHFNDDKTKQKIGQFVKEFYFDDINESVDQSYADYFHDVLFEYPIVKSATLYAEQSYAPLFLMKLIYRQNSEELTEGSVRENIIDYIFASENLEEDEDVVNTLITLLCNFIKLGDPTPITTTLIPIIWQPVQEDSVGRLNIRTASILLFDNGLTMSSTATSPRLAFWDQVYENFYKTQTPLHEENVDVEYTEQ